MALSIIIFFDRLTVQYSIALILVIMIFGLNVVKVLFYKKF